MVEKLVLAGPGLSGWQDWSAEDTTWLIAARRAAHANDSVGMALAWLTSDYMRPAMEQPRLANRLRAIASDNATYWMGLFRHGEAERNADPPALGRLAAVRSPTLLLIGDRDSPVIRRIVDTLASSIPGAALVVIRGAGHMANMERPAEFNRAVLTFLSGRQPQLCTSTRDTARPPAPATGDAPSAAQRDTLLAEARARRAAWRARGITDYRIRVAVGCFCPWPSDPRVLDVRDGKAVALLDTLGRPEGKLREPWAPNTVEGMFDYIEQSARSADVLTVRYDACLGYPTEIRGDQKLGQVDDWFWVKATGLAPRR